MDTLWNIIRDFFVQYVFGGISSDETWYGSFFGGFYFLDAENGYVHTLENTDTLFVPVGNYYGDNYGSVLGSSTYISIGDWLSTTATIITLVALFVGIALLTIKLFKMVSNLIALR